MHRGRTAGSGPLRRLVAATAISSLGDGLALVAFPLLAVRLTTHAILIAGLVAAARLPWLLCALPAGAIADRADRRRLVTTVELARAVLIAALALAIATGRLSLVELYIAAFLVGTGETVVSAATRAMVPLIVADEDLLNANGRINAAYTVGVQFAGPALGGIIFSLAASLPFVGDAVTYVASAGLLRSTVPRTAARATAIRTSVRTDVRSGLRWFLANPTLRILALVLSSFAFFQAMVLAVLVIYTTRILGLGEVGYGIFLAVAAVGDVLASLLAGRVHDRLGPYVTVLAAGAIAGASYVALGSTTDLYLAVAALALEAAASSLGNVATLSIRHRIIPTERFGVVNNAFRMCITGLIPLGALAGGVLTATYGTRMTFVIAGACQVVVLAALARPLRRSREVAPGSRESRGISAWPEPL
ncbi:MAG: Major facilitator superfamily Permease [Acidimicrobiaceae bacterium]|nr:Major facilitator superfamily Permease [Acidimicrobiaceae bacterium]